MLSPSVPTGKERDTESGNDYFGARYYASSMGRFMSPDWAAKAEPVPYAKMDNPQSLNLYIYMRTNPLGGVDADGHSPWSWFTDKVEQIANSALGFGWMNDSDRRKAEQSQQGTVTMTETYSMMGLALAGTQIATQNSAQQGTDDAIQQVQNMESSAGLGDITFTHFTNAEGLQGITGLDPASLTPGQTTTVNELNFGTGSNTYLAGQEGDNFVTNLPSNASSLSLSQIGVFGDKQSFGISFSGEAAASQGVLVRGLGNNIYTLPANSSFTGCFIIVCR